MMLKKLSGLCMSFALMAMVSVSAVALPITQKCGVGTSPTSTVKKYMTLDSADACLYAAGGGAVNDFKAMPEPDVTTYLGGAGPNGSSLGGVFQLLFGAGSGWGNQNASGTWTFLDTNFWTKYTNVWIGFHVGGPSGDGANDFMFEVTKNTMGGSWSFVNTTGKGGFSAVHLFVDKLTTPPPGGDNPPPTKVPEPSALLLMVLGLAGLRFARRSIR